LARLLGPDLDGGWGDGSRSSGVGHLWLRICDGGGSSSGLGAAAVVDPASGGADGLGGPMDGLAGLIHCFFFFLFFDFINQGGHQTASEKVSEAIGQNASVKLFHPPPLIFYVVVLYRFCFLYKG
jgi:hypothetical protein